MNKMLNRRFLKSLFLFLAVPLFSSLTCEGTNIKLECPVGSVIDIKSAFWGRQDLTTCRDPQKLLSVNCTQPDTKDIVTELCQFQNSCYLSSSSSMFGEPCAGTYKYLTTSFNCIGKFIHRPLRPYLMT